MMKKCVLRFGLPKGSLQDATIEKMAKAGFNISVSTRCYCPDGDDQEMEIRLIRAQEISRYVEHGYLDCGITGHDWIEENGSRVHEVGEFQFSKEMEIRLIRAQEISRYVEHGYLDCGITGHDWIEENGSRVHEVGEFQFSK